LAKKVIKVLAVSSIQKSEASNEETCGFTFEPFSKNSIIQKSLTHILLSSLRKTYTRPIRFSLSSTEKKFHSIFKDGGDAVSTFFFI
jgi:hypothetical protein